jgi:hypothetical protein
MKVFSYYLPQFHPDKMNDLFWGSGFTDWVTTTKAKPLFNGHEQPIFPGELGSYDLRSVEILTKQAIMAKSFGVDGFAFYNYIFDADTSALDTPINNLRNHPEIDIEYFVCWVNADWTKSWIGDDQTFLYKQSYDDETLVKVIRNACWHFSDSRYLSFDGTPIFYIHNPKKFDFNIFKDKFLRISSKLGFPKVLFACPEIHCPNKYRSNIDFFFGYPPGDYSSISMKFHSIYRRLLKVLGNNKFLLKYFKCFSSTSYSKFVYHYSSYINQKSINKKYIPCILSGWDNTPRYAHRGFVFHNFNSTQFEKLSINAFKISKTNKKELLMIKAWNEWAEGNILEPCKSKNHSTLKALYSARIKVFN